MYSFVKSRFHSTALALKSQDTKYCSSEFYFVFLQCTIVREAHFLSLFYFMAKGPLLVAFKWATQKQNKTIKKEFEFMTQGKSLCLKTIAFKMLKMLRDECVT